MATQQQIDEVAALESAYVKLISGSKAAVVVDSTGERVEWAKANTKELKAYIREKKLEYGIVSATQPVRAFF